MKNTDEPNDPRGQLEARVTALLLGQLSAGEAEAVRREIETDPELRGLHHRMERTIVLVREAASGIHEPASARLPEEKRQKLLAHFKTVQPGGLRGLRRREWSWLLPMSAAAMLVLLLGAVALLQKPREHLWVVSSYSPYSLGETRAEGIFFPGRSRDLSEVRRARPQSPADENRDGVVNEQEIQRYGMDWLGRDDDSRASGFVEHRSGIVRQNSRRSFGIALPASDAPVSRSRPDIFGDADLDVFHDNPAGRDLTRALNESGEAGYKADGQSAIRVGGSVVVNQDVFGSALDGRESEQEAKGTAAEPRSEPALQNRQNVTSGLRGFYASGPQPTLEALPVVGGMFESEWSDSSGRISASAPPERGSGGRGGGGWGGFAGAEQEGQQGQQGQQGQRDRFEGLTEYYAGSLSGSAVAGLGGIAGGGELGDRGRSQRNNGRMTISGPQAAEGDEIVLPSRGDSNGTLNSSQQSALGLRDAKQYLSEGSSRLSLEARLSPAAVPQAREADSLSRELKQLESVRDILQRRIDLERADFALSGEDPAAAAAAETRAASPRTLWERLRGTGNQIDGIIQISSRRESSDIPGLSAPPDDPFFLATEAEKLKSQEVLSRTVEHLNLENAWAHGNGRALTRDEAVERLRRSIEVGKAPSGDMLEVRVRGETNEEAARVAQGIAEAYREWRRDQRERIRLEGLVVLEKALAEKNRQIAGLGRQEQLDQLSQSLAVTDGDRLLTLERRERSAAPALTPQPEVRTRENPLSTFSLNVSDVSFKLAAASLERGVMPDAASIRTEEFINAFDYRDSEPPPGVPVGFAWERARYPFAHNRDVVRFSVKTGAAGREPGRPLNIVLALDNSGSMERADRVRIINEALRVLSAQLQPQDKLSVVSFARTARLWVDGVPGDRAGEVAAQVGSLAPQGGTNLEEALKLSYATALRHYTPGGVNRVVLLTDGAANLGNSDPETLKQMVDAHRHQGVAFDCFGVGWEGYNDDLLEILSRNGNGRYGFINTPEEAASGFAGQLAGALRVAASDVKVQVEFNPARVTAYRQMGYAKHQLTAQQFRDNTVDAAELGAAESGNALYVIEVNPAGQGPLGVVRVRFQSPATGDYHEHEWQVPYAGNAPALDESGPSMRLAATAAAFSEWLVSSPYAGETDPDRLLAHLRGVPEVYGADERPKTLEEMIRRARR